jgi:hypothetical protein
VVDKVVGWPKEINPEILRDFVATPVSEQESAFIVELPLLKRLFAWLPIYNPFSFEETGFNFSSIMTILAYP